MNDRCNMTAMPASLLSAGRLFTVLVCTLLWVLPGQAQTKPFPFCCRNTYITHRI